jgi:hypothetical protein
MDRALAHPASSPSWPYRPRKSTLADRLIQRTGTVARLCETYAPLVEGVDGYAPEVCLADVVSYHPFGHKRAVTAATIMDSDPSLFDPVRRARAMLFGTVGEPEAEALRDLILDPAFTDVEPARAYDMNVAVRRGWPTLSPEVHERARAEAEARLADDPKNLAIIDMLLSPPPMPVFVAGRTPPEPDPAAIERLARARVEAAPYDPHSWSALSGTATDRGVPLDPVHGIASANMVAYGNHKPDYLTMFATNRSNLFVSLPPGEARDAVACEVVRADRLLREVCSAYGSSEWWCSQTDFSQPYWQSTLDHAKSEALCAWDLDAPLTMIAFRPPPATRGVTAAPQPPALPRSQAASASASMRPCATSTTTGPTSSTVQPTRTPLSTRQTSIA